MSQLVYELYFEMAISTRVTAGMKQRRLKSWNAAMFVEGHVLITRVACIYQRL